MKYAFTVLSSNLQAGFMYSFFLSSRILLARTAVSYRLNHWYIIRNLWRLHKKGAFLFGVSVVKHGQRSHFANHTRPRHFADFHMAILLGIIMALQLTLTGHRSICVST